MLNRLRSRGLPLLWPLPHGWRHPLAEAPLRRGVLQICAITAQSEDQTIVRQILWIILEW